MEHKPILDNTDGTILPGGVAVLGMPYARGFTAVLALNMPWTSAPRVSRSA